MRARVTEDKELEMIGLPTTLSKSILPIKFFAALEKGFFGKEERDCIINLRVFLSCKAPEI
jgi:hypothetical protein